MFNLKLIDHEYKNSISIQIPEADLQTARDALNTIKTILSPYLVALSPSERQTIPKMGDGTVPFVEKVMEYALNDGQFLPPFLDLEEMDKDWKRYTIGRDLGHVQ